jgi:hypothetical protein
VNQILKLSDKRRVTESQGCHFETPSQSGTDTIFLENRFGIDGDRIKLFIRLRNPRNNKSMISTGMIYAAGQTQGQNRFFEVDD